MENFYKTFVKSMLLAFSLIFFPLLILAQPCSITDQSVIANPDSVCPGNSSTITVGFSEPGIYYTLRNHADNTVVTGPLPGTGSALNFNIGPLNSATTFNVLAETDKYSVYLDGGQAGFIIPSSPALDVTNNFTIEGWIKPDGTLDYSRMFNKSQAYALGLSNGQSQINFTRHNGGDYSLPFSFVTGQWYHIACTYVSGTVEFFVNGASIGSVGGVPGILIQSSGAQIGSETSSFHHFRGNIDNVRLWNSVRTVSEIAANQSTYLTSSGNPTLAASWWISEGTGSTTRDFSANGVHAVSLGGTWQADSPIPFCDLQLTNTPHVSIDISSITLTSAPESDNQNVALNSSIAQITYTTTGASGATFSNLPPGVSGNWNSNVITISGTPNEYSDSPYQYLITLTGACGLVTASGTIEVNNDCNIALFGIAPTLVPIINPDFEILYKTASTTVTSPTFTNSQVAFGNSHIDMEGPAVTFSDLSEGNRFDMAGWAFSSLMGVVNWNSNFDTPRDMIAWINGAIYGGGTEEKTMSQILDEDLVQNTTYTLTADFGWRHDNPNPSPPVLKLYAGATLLTAISSESPPLIKGGFVTFKSTYKVNNPEISGPLRIEVGIAANESGNQLSIDHVTLNKTTEAFQSVCVNSPITDVIYITNGATGAVFSGLPPGVNGLWIDNIVTISGTPSVAGTFHFSVAPTGTVCSGITENGTIQVIPLTEITQPDNLIICNGTQTNQIDFQSSEPVEIFTWTNSNPDIGLPSQGTGPIPSFLATNTGELPLTANIEVAINTLSTVDFNYTGSVQEWTVPPGVTSVQIEAWGAQGGANWSGNNNFGGYASGNLEVTPGEVLYIYVGEQPNGISGGFNGGGNGEGAGQGGGGASDVRQGGNSMEDRKIVAAGGGGAGNWSSQHVVGGIGGGLTGGNGYREPSYEANPGGTGATQSGGGNGTCVNFYVTAMAGGFGFGGSPSGCGCEGYGGGGGWYGGAGSGNCRGGGGGSSYIGSVTDSTTTGGINAGHGRVSLIYSSNLSCAGNPVNFSIVVNPTPDVMAIPASQTICSGTSIETIALSGNLNGTVYSWVRDNPIAVTGIAAAGTGDINGSLTNTTNAPVTVTFTITPTVNDCTGTIITATITVNPSPDVTATPPNQSICNNNQTNISLSSNVPETEFTWIIQSTSGSVSGQSSGSGNIIAQNLFNSGTSAATVTYRITPATIAPDNCEGPYTDVTITISPSPEITCPEPLTVNSSTDGPGNCSGTAFWNHPSISADVCGPVVLNMTIDGNSPVSVTQGADFMQMLDIGSHVVTYDVVDGAGNSDFCSFTITIVDDESPVASCSNQSYTFNGESEIILNANDLVDAFDNCEIQSISVNPLQITPDQVGQSIPYTATVTDVNENSSTCNAFISVSGLPPGWSQNVNGVNCANGNNVTYNPTNQVWTATSTNCYYSSPFTNDAMSFAQHTLCGNGSITAQVTSISGNAFGWAGVTMRESNAAGAKKVQLTANLNSNLNRREVRSVTNGQAIPQQVPALNRYWLRIVRTGNQFVAYSSPNGTNWFQVMAANISMNACIEIGLVLSNYTQNSTVNATFANVSIVGGIATLPSPDNNIAVSGIGEKHHNFEVYPNPSNGELFIDMPSYAGKAVRIELYNIHGQILHVFERDESVFDQKEQLNLSGYAPGMYFVKLKSAGLPDSTKRVVLQGNQNRP